MNSAGLQVRPLKSGCIGTWKSQGIRSVSWFRLGNTRKWDGHPFPPQAWNRPISSDVAAPSSSRPNGAMPTSEGCNPGMGIALEWVGTPGTGMRSEGTPPKDGSERERHFLDRRRSFRTRGHFGRCSQGSTLGLVCVAPLGRVNRMDWQHCAAMGRETKPKPQKPPHSK
jgi:hypothetical protein